MRGCHYSPGTDLFAPKKERVKAGPPPSLKYGHSPLCLKPETNNAGKFVKGWVQIPFVKQMEIAPKASSLYIHCIKQSRPNELFALGNVIGGLQAMHSLLAQCDCIKVCNMIRRKMKQRTQIPYRRRDFEASDCLVLGRSFSALAKIASHSFWA